MISGSSPSSSLAIRSFSASFRFFSSGMRKTDKPGDLLDRWTDEELAETDSLEALLPKDDAIEDDRETLPHADAVWRPVPSHRGERERERLNSSGRGLESH